MSEEVPADLQALAQYLQVLDLPLAKVPTVEATRKAFRAKLKLHPDIAGAASNTIFQEITQAFRIINLFIADNSDHDTAASDSTNKDDDLELLKMLQKQNRLSFNQMSGTFAIQKDEVEAWMSVLEKKLKTTRESLKDQSKGFKIKSEKVKIPHANIDVTVAVRLWPNPSDGTPKMVLEGKGYWAFVMCVLPSLIKTVKELKSNLQIKGLSPVGTPGLTTDISSGPSAATVSSAQSSPFVPSPGVPTVAGSLAPVTPTINSLSNNSLVNDPPAAPSMVTAKVSDALGKVEAAVLDHTTETNNRLNSLEMKLEQLCNEVKVLPNKKEISDLNKNLASLSKAVTESVNAIESSCQKVSETTVTLTSAELGQVTDQLVPIIKSSLTDSLTQLSGKVEALNEVTNQVAAQAKLAAVEQAGLNKNLAGLPQLVASLQAALDNPKVNLTPTKQNSSPSGGSSPAGPVRRKCILFTSSIGKEINIEKLQDELNSDINYCLTYHIERQAHLSEPSPYLALQINEVMCKKVDFVIIQVGSNEMTNLDLSSDKQKLFDTIQEDCDKLINIAKHLVTEYEIDVFISEKPPRFDQKCLEFGGILEGLNNTSNSILHMRSHLLDRIFIIKQSMLESKSERVRNERFKPDGLHLTEKGLSLLSQNWVDQIKKVYEDIPDLISTPQDRKPSNSRSGGGGNLSDHSDQQTGGRGRGNGGGVRGRGRGYRGDHNDRDYQYDRDQGQYGRDQGQYGRDQGQYGRDQGQFGFNSNRGGWNRRGGRRDY